MSEDTTDKCVPDVTPVPDSVPAAKPEKKARQFDFMQMLEESKKTAQERSKESNDKREAEEQRQRIHHMAINTNADNKHDSGLDSDNDEIGPELPPGFEGLGIGDPGPSHSPIEDNEFAEHDIELSVEQIIPASLEANLTHGTKPVSCLAIDSQGARFATGGHDYVVKMWDFGGMDAGFRSFREIQPVESNIVRTVSFSCNGENMVVGSGLPVVKILDRQGSQWGETIRGDMYLVDQINTKGHVAGINASAWHPNNKQEFITSSDDCTVRIWNTADWKGITKCIPMQRSVIRVKNKQGKKAVPNCCAYSRDAKYIAAGSSDGSIQLWQHRKIFVNASLCKRDAHANGCDMSSIAFSYDNNYLLSRSFDDTMKLWDLRYFKNAVHTATDLENHYASTPCMFSPRDELCCTGTSIRKGKGQEGRMVFLDKTTFKPVYQIKYPDQSVTAFNWHPKLNQMLVGLSNGKVKLYYDSKQSNRGALLCVKKPIKRERAKEVLCNEIIMSPLALDMFQPRGPEGEEKEVTAWRLKKYLRNQSRDPNQKFKKAEPPQNGPSAGGRIAESGSTLHSFFLQNLGVSRNRDFLADKDVRSSILRHADDAEKDPIFVGHVYEKTQPVPIFQDTTEAPEEKEEEELQPHFKKPKLN